MKLNKYLLLACLILFVGFLFVGNLYISLHKANNINLSTIDNINKTNDTLTDKLGRKETVTVEVPIHTKQAEKMLRDSMSYINNKYYKLLREAKRSDIKVKHLQQAFNIVSEGFNNITVKTIIKDTCYISKFNDGFLLADINSCKDSTKLTYKYTEKINIFGYKSENKLTKKGRKRLFLVRWIFPRFDTKFLAKSLNKNTTIKEFDKIKIYDK